MNFFKNHFFQRLLGSKIVQLLENRPDSGGTLLGGGLENRGGKPSQESLES